MSTENYNDMLYNRLEFLWDHRHMPRAQSIVEHMFFTNPFPCWVNRSWNFQYYDEWIEERTNRNNETSDILFNMIYHKIAPMVPNEICGLIFDFYYTPL